MRLSGMLWIAALLLLTLSLGDVEGRRKWRMEDVKDYIPGWQRIERYWPNRRRERPSERATTAAPTSPQPSILRQYQRIPGVSDYLNQLPTSFDSVEDKVKDWWRNYVDMHANRHGDWWDRRMSGRSSSEGSSDVTNIDSEIDVDESSESRELWRHRPGPKKKHNHSKKNSKSLSNESTYKRKHKGPGHHRPLHSKEKHPHSKEKHHHSKEKHRHSREKSSHSSHESREDSDEDWSDEDWSFTSSEESSESYGSNESGSSSEEWCWYCMPTTQQPTTTEQGITGARRCSSFNECGLDECCLWDGMEFRCARLSTEGERCSMSYRGFLQSCPCAVGLECVNELEAILEENPSLTSFFQRLNPGQWVQNTCRRAETTTQTMELTTTNETTTVPGETTTVQEEIASTSEYNTTTTESRARRCENHFDCEFLECCVREADDEAYCSAFAAVGEPCSPIDLFATSTVLDHCPCQTFTDCQVNPSADSPSLQPVCG